MEIVSTDPIAEVFFYCARPLRTLVGTVIAGTHYLTADQSARLYRVPPQAVSAWIRAGRLDAARTPRGYRIRRDAQPKREGKLKKAPPEKDE